MKSTHCLRLPFVVLFLVACSCQRSQEQARHDLSRELAARQENQALSMQLYESGAAAHKAGRLADARQDFTAAVSADRQNVYAWMALGAVHFQLDNYYQAAAAFHEASRLAPTRYEPHYNLGAVYEAVGRFNDAIKAYETALGFEPDQLEVMENLARTYVRANHKSDQVRELVDRALLQEDRPQWRQWLLLQTVRLSSTTQPTARP